MAELAFKQVKNTGGILGNTEGQSSYHTNIVVYIADKDLGDTVYASRCIFGTIKQIYLKHDGTIGDVAKKVNNLSSIPDLMFRDLSSTLEEAKKFQDSTDNDYADTH